DAKDPRFEGGASFKAIEPAQDGQPGVLDNILGLGPIGDVNRRQADQRAVITADECCKRRLVAVAQRRDEAALLRVAVVRQRWCLTHVAFLAIALRGRRVALFERVGAVKISETPGNVKTATTSSTPTCNVSATQMTSR